MLTDDALFKSEHGRAKIMALYDREVARSATAPEVLVVQTRHGKTHILSGGPADARPVVVLHGWGSNASRHWDGFSWLLSSHRVYFPDIIGQPGKSAPTRLPTRGPAYAEWISDILDELALSSCSLIGISGGAWLAFKFAAHHPRRAERVAAISPMGLVRFSMSRLLGRTLLNGFLPITPDSGLEWLLSQEATKAPWFETFAEQVKLTRKYCKAHLPPGLLADSELRRITCPTLILLGKQDYAFSPSAIVERARIAIPGLVAAKIVPRSGHLLVLEQPAQVRKHIHAFFHPSASARTKHVTTPAQVGRRC